MWGQTLLSKLFHLNTGKFLALCCDKLFFSNNAFLILGKSLLCDVKIVVLHQSFTSHVYSVFLGQLDLTRGWPYRDVEASLLSYQVGAHLAFLDQGVLTAPFDPKYT